MFDLLLDGTVYVLVCLIYKLNFIINYYDDTEDKTQYV